MFLEYWDSLHHVILDRAATPAQEFPKGYDSLRTESFCKINNSCVCQGGKSGVPSLMPAAFAGVLVAWMVKGSPGRQVYEANHAAFRIPNESSAGEGIVADEKWYHLGSGNLNTRFFTMTSCRRATAVDGLPVSKDIAGLVVLLRHGTPKGMQELDKCSLTCTWSATLHRVVTTCSTPLKPFRLLA